MTKLNFLELPEEVQLEIIETLYSYEGCHIEQPVKSAKMIVCTSYALRSNYPEGFYLISQEFTRKELWVNRPFGKDWGTTWAVLAGRGWGYMSAEEKDLMYKAEKIILRTWAKKDLEMLKYLAKQDEE